MLQHSSHCFVNQRRAVLSHRDQLQWKHGGQWSSHALSQCMAGRLIRGPTYTSHHATVSNMFPSSTNRRVALKSVATVHRDQAVATHYPTLVIGAGPVGLCTAIMLAQRGMNVKVIERLPPPPAPDDMSVWGDFEITSDRLYLIGLNGRGQKVLRELGVWVDVEKFCSSVTGRMDFNNNKDPMLGRKTSYTTRTYTTKCLQRDRLAGALLRVIREKYPQVSVSFGVEVKSCDWVADDDGAETVRLALKQENADGQKEQIMATSHLVMAADGAGSTVRKAMEEDSEQKDGPFKVTRFPNTNEYKYRTIPIHWPKESVASGDRPLDLNYSVRHAESDINMDCLPTPEGPLIGVVLYRPGCPQIGSIKTQEDAKNLFNRIFPAFTPALRDGDFARFAEKKDSSLPSFSYSGPRLNRGGSTALLGDAIHCVKPYFGQGVNSGFEDVAIMKRALDESKDLASGVKHYSDLRAKDAEALVDLSRSLDGGFLTFVLPLIIDSIFHRLLPQFFSSNIIANLMNESQSFSFIREKKKKERILQGVILLGLASLALAALTRIVKQIISLIASAPV